MRMLSNHPVKFSFVLANLGTDLSYGGDALNAGVPREPLPGEDPVPGLDQPARLRTKGFPLPTTFRVGLAYDLLTGANNRLTLLSDFNQPNNNSAGFVVGGEWALQRLGGSAFGVALRGSYRYTAANNIERRATRRSRRSRMRRTCRALALGGGLNVPAGGLQPGRRLRLQVSRHPGRHQLLQLQRRLVGCRSRALVQKQVACGALL